VATLLSALPEMAEAPRVVSDIPTTHSLVSVVMGETGEPVLLMQSNASSHHYALRPSEALSLEKADIIFWTRADLTPWLARATHSLADDARSIELMKSAGTQILGFRDAAVKIAGQADHGRQSTHLHDHDSPGAIDPHGWLDPADAQRW